MEYSLRINTAYIQLLKVLKVPVTSGFFKIYIIDMKTLQGSVITETIMNINNINKLEVQKALDINIIYQ